MGTIAGYIVAAAILAWLKFAPYNNFGGPTL